MQFVPRCLVENKMEWVQLMAWCQTLSIKLSIFLAVLLTDAERSVIRPSVHFSNQIASLNFHSIFPIFGLNVHKSIAHTMDML